MSRGPCARGVAKFLLVEQRIAKRHDDRRRQPRQPLAAEKFLDVEPDILIIDPQGAAGEVVAPALVEPDRGGLFDSDAVRVRGVNARFDFGAGVGQPAFRRALGRKEAAMPLPVLIVIISEPGDPDLAFAVCALALTYCASH